MKSLLPFCLLLCVTELVQAQGVITFRGMVLEPTCQISGRLPTNVGQPRDEHCNRADQEVAAYRIQLIEPHGLRAGRVNRSASTDTQVAERQVQTYLVSYH